MAQQNNKNTAANVVICGGGVIGVCVAYYLAQREEIASITIIERHKIAGCASGKSGGFLALDWCDNGWLEPLARKSFQLHTELGKKYGHKYLYRRCAAYSINSKYSKIPTKPQKIAKYNELHWIDSKITKHKVLGTKQTNAQVHPRMFCETLIELVQNKVNIKYGIVTNMIFDKNQKNKVIGVEYRSINNSESQQIKCSFVVIALGPWSTQAYQWFPQCSNLAKISSYKVNSIEVQPMYSNEMKMEHKNESQILDSIGDGTFLHLSNADMSDMNEKKMCEIKQMENVSKNKLDSLGSLDGVIYLKHKSKNGTNIHIEIYPRPDGTVYSCGPAQRIPIPKDPATITGDKYTENIFIGLKELSSQYLKHSEMIVRQACYLPESEDDAPFIGQITNYKNAFIGTAHRVWGILNGPATGLILAQLIVDGKVTLVSQDAFERWCPSRV